MNTIPAVSDRNHWRILLVNGVLFVGAYLVARVWIKSAEQGSGEALAAALLPVPFFGSLLFQFVRGVRSMDELERRIQLEALAIVFPSTIMIAFVAGLLHLAGFHGTNDFDPPRLWPVLILPYFFGIMIARRRYT